MFAQSLSGNVLDTTYFGTAAMRAAIGAAGSGALGQKAAQAEVARWHGTLVKSTGDGILARFDAPTRALRCALALSAAAKRMGIEIRSALHTGEVEIRRDDLGGIGVHIASRALAEAGPGEVLVTRTVRDLVTGTEVEFSSRGSVGLRGVPGEWELFSASLR